jgi:large subunit ribosomal protein L25
MEKFTLNAEVRNETEKARDLRIAKQLPAVVYGKKTEPISIKLNYSEFLKLFRKAGESHIINLVVDKKDIEVLVHAVQKQPITGAYTHIDFYAITKGEKVQTNIALVFT